MPSRPEVVGEVAHRALQRRLGDAHDVVVRRHPLRAEVGQRQDRAAAPHQRRRPPGQVDEAVAGDVERVQEVRPAGVEEAPVELGLVGIGDGVDQHVEPAPVGGDPREERVERGRRPARRPARTIFAPRLSASGITRRPKPSPW